MMHAAFFEGLEKFWEHIYKKIWVIVVFVNDTFQKWKWDHFHFWNQSESDLKHLLVHWLCFR